MPMNRRSYSIIRLLLPLCIVILALQPLYANASNNNFEKPRSYSQWRFSTNILPYSLTIINAAAEYIINPKISVELPVFYCPWHFNNTFSVRTLAIQPDCRYWIKDATRGHYIGIHANIAQYNLLNHRDRYQDRVRPLLGVGLSYGYLLPFNSKWSALFSIGIGYSSTIYKRFYNIDNGAHIDNRSTHYIGIDMIGASIVYNL